MLKFDCTASDGITKAPLSIDLGTESVTFGLGWPAPAVVRDDTISWAGWQDQQSVTYTFFRKRGVVAESPASEKADPDKDGQYTCTQLYPGQGS
ncbi:MAG TPA: hypothetical protein VMU22_15345 [Rhizomicrobium sp.]|nr:hypothetical protein [Rhizomicrobium sp.]